MNAILYARDNDKPGNIELIKFLKDNIQELFKTYKFTFVIVDDAMEKQLLKKNIDRLPAAEINGRAYTDVLAAFSGKSVKRPATDVEGSMREFYESEMNMQKYEIEKDQDENSGKDIMARVQNEVERRQSNDKAQVKKKPERREAREPERAVKKRGTHVENMGGDPLNSDDIMLSRLMETSED